MKPERWKQIDQLLDSALQREANQRPAFLERACAGDEELRREVESLLAHKDRAESFIEGPALEAAAKGLAAGRPQSLVGRQVGPYKILAPLGAGGMGEVYKAHDSRLDRIDALKILPLEFASDQDRMQRFVREARAASALNHTNVAHIYEIGQSDGLHFIAMEYVEGQSLAQKMSGQPLELTEVLEIGIQAADALEEAHRKGITHRDIKSANLMITAKGQVKVLDFGLAKITRPEGEAAGSDVSTSIHTAQGVVMGTLRYMSPEQVLGKELDARTDLFSLGVVLYEMTTGRLPFSGNNASEVTDRILHAQPEALARFNYEVPTELERIIRKCLEKDRERRYQWVRELLIDLKNLKRDIELGQESVEKVTPRPWSNIRRITVVATTLAVVVLLASVVYLYTWRVQTIDSMAVLPFVNASADPSTEYLSDGIAESLINSLSQLPKLRVMSRNSVFRFKGRETDAQAAGRALKVSAVLTGRVVQHGDNLVISVEMVDVQNNSHLWGEQYNRKVSDIFVLQEEIAKQIYAKLRFRLTSEDEKRLTKRYTENTEAYQVYLKGRYYWDKRTKKGLETAIQFFKQAIEIDPNYALAYAGMADSYNSLAGHFVLPPSEAQPKAKAAATKALEIDDQLSEAWTSLACVNSDYYWDWSEAERQFKRAIELKPNYLTAHQWYSEHLARMGRLDESMTEARKALELDPLSSGASANLGWALYRARQYDQAIEQLRSTIEMAPDFLPAYRYLGMTYLRKGMNDEAAEEFQKGRGNSDLVALLGYAQAVSGKRKEAQKVLAELNQLSKQQYVSPFGIARIYVGLGEEDRAFEWLEKAYEERTWLMGFLKVEPIFDSLRSDPRFQDLLRRMGLPP